MPTPKTVPFGRSHFEQKWRGSAAGFLEKHLASNLGKVTKDLVPCCCWSDIRFERQRLDPPNPSDHSWHRPSFAPKSSPIVSSWNADSDPYHWPENHRSRLLRAGVSRAIHPVCASCPCRRNSTHRPAVHSTRAHPLVLLTDAQWALEKLESPGGRIEQSLQQTYSHVLRPSS